MTNQELFEANRCFKTVCEMMSQYDISYQSVLFGSTLQTWLDDRQLRIVLVCEPPINSRCFVRARLPSQREETARGPA